jgi:hypothetical protein
MINRSNSKLNSITIHSIGNQSVGTDIEFSSKPFDLEDESLKDAFLNHCLDAFKEPLYYKFNIQSISEIGNTVFNECAKVFNQEADLYESSVNIARHLFNKSTNSNIKQSFFIAAHISDIFLDDELFDGILLCKLEIKDQFLNFEKTDIDWDMKQEFGYLPGKIDKICIVLNANQEDGFKILNIDKTNPGSDAKYWKDDFLNIALSGNDYTYTSDYIKLTSNFLKNRKPIDDILERGDEVKVLCRSQDYFKNNEKFEEEEYKKEVFQDNKLINAFDNYKESWQEKTQRPLAQAFDLDEFAINKQSKVFRSVIKLDRNFHIYVHGDNNKIMKGVDDEGKKYYILYYNEES